MAHIARPVPFVDDLDALLETTIGLTTNFDKIRAENEYRTTVGSVIGYVSDIIVKRGMDIHRLVRDTSPANATATCSFTCNVITSAELALTRLWRVEHKTTFREDLLSVWNMCDGLIPVFAELGGDLGERHWTPPFEWSYQFTPYPVFREAMEGDNINTRTATPVPSPAISPLPSPRSSQDRGERRFEVDDEAGDLTSPPHLKRQATSAV